MIRKLLKISKTPLTLLFLWIAFLLSPLLGVFRMYYVVRGNFLGIYIRGFSTFLFYLPFLISSIALVVLVIWFNEFIGGKLSEVHKRVLMGMSALTVVFLIIAAALINLEFNNYPNYVYSHYGVTVSQLQFMSFVAALELLVILTIFSYGLTTKGGTNLTKYWERVDKSKLEIVSLFLAIVGFLSLLILSFQPFVNWPTILKGSRGGYESKFGIHYRYLDLLAKYTPYDGTIIHPPQGEKWPAIGNQPVIRYFLFPRTLVSGALLAAQEFARNFESAYFVEIDAGSDSTHWPEIDTKGKTVIFDEKNKIRYRKLEIYKEQEGIKIFKITF